MKFYSLILLLILSMCAILFPRDFDYRDIPIHENGRIKPLDTFVRNQLLLIYGKRSIKQDALPEEIEEKFNEVQEEQVVEQPETATPLLDILQT